MNFTNSLRINSVHSINPFAPSVRLFKKVINTLVVWNHRSQERYQLKDIDNHLLEDMGISRADALTEARKPFWQA